MKRVNCMIIGARKWISSKTNKPLATVSWLEPYEDGYGTGAAAYMGFVDSITYDGAIKNMKQQILATVDHRSVDGKQYHSICID